MKWIIAGLGNPGNVYEQTRHNVGQLLVKKLSAQLLSSEWKRDNRVDAQIASVEIEGLPVFCVLPETFMNESGQSVRKLVKTSEEVERLIVVHDDLDLLFGKTRVSFGRGSGGNNGIRSIIDHIKTKDFWRVRVGIKNAELETLKLHKDHEAIGKFVLKKFTPEEEAQFTNLVEDVHQKIKDIVLGTTHKPPSKSPQVS